MVFREPDEKELKTISKGLNYFKVINFLDDHAFLMREIIEGVREVFTMSKDVAEFVSRFKKKILFIVPV